jgi:D-hexose-6-phosphate mutarotase
LILQSLLAKANQLEKHSSLRAAFHSYWNVEKAREGFGGVMIRQLHSGESFQVVRR